MGGTTPKALPYPTGTDRVMDGDNAIEALARAVDYGNAQKLSGSTITAAALLAAYPDGLSTLMLSGADASAGGWPYSSTAHAIQCKQNNDRIWQLWYRNSLVNPEVLYRAGSATAWSPWVPVATPSASGTAVLQFTSSATASVVVTFPVGQFSAAPGVVLTQVKDSTVILVSPGSTTASSVTISGRHYKDAVSSYSINLAWSAQA